MSDGDRVTREMEVLRWRDGTVSRYPDVVAEETLVTFHVEPLGVLDIVMAPESLHAFILGHLFCEGLVPGPEGLLALTVADRGDRLEAIAEVDASLAGPSDDDAPPSVPVRRGLIQTECGAPPAWPTRPLAPIEGSLGINVRALAGIPGAVKDRTGLFVETGAFHYAFLLDARGVPIVEAFDVGRHTAVDKAVGKALLASASIGESVLYTTGRISSDVASKCIRARIPLVASRGAPLTGAVGLAERNNLCMVGFLRGGRFNVYAGEGHIDWD